MLARVQPRKGHRLLGRIKTQRPTVIGQQRGDGLVAQAGDAVQQLPLRAQPRIVVDLLADGRLDVGQGLLQIAQVGLDARSHVLISHPQPVALLGAHGVQGIAAGNQGTQCPHRRRR